MIKKQKEISVPDFNRIREIIEKKAGARPRLPSDLPAGVWTEQALKVLEERYLMKDETGKVIETPEELCWRVAWEIASAEVVWGSGRTQVAKIAEDFYRLMINFRFLPNSPTLMNAGTGNNMQYSACFVLPVTDSLVGIFDALKYQALIHQTGGGTGFSFSRLRPKGSIVRSSRGTASGPISFMKIFDAATNEIKQGGKRRGANMGILRVDHPDILDFIHCKESGKITNFNISVAITNEFMRAYEKGEDYDLIDPRTNEKIGRLSAKQVFDEIAAAAWATGDPGLIFIDKVNEGFSNPVPVLGPIEATNPCGEVPLYPFDACNLGSIFFSYFINDGEIEWEKLSQAVVLATRFLDNVIEVNPFPLEEIRKTVLSIRRIGLGIGGWADGLLKLGIPYDSDEAIKLAEKLMKFVREKAIETSWELAKIRGPFPLWKESIFAREKPRRNATVTTIAPTGSISIIAGTSSGIEPLFAVAFRHIVKDESLDRTLTFINPIFKTKMKDDGLWNQKLETAISESGCVREIEYLPESVRQVFGTAHEIQAEWHIKTQAAFQKYTDNAVSKTINLKTSSTVDEVKYCYLQAWKQNCKGITVFRDGCKDAQVLNVGTKMENGKSENYFPTTLTRPFRVTGATYKLKTPVGTAFITINQDGNGEPLELFINVGKAGSDVTALAEALGRSISTALRFQGGLKPVDRAQEIAMQLAGIGGRRSVGFGSNKILSLPDAVAAALSIHFNFKINGFARSYPKSEIISEENFSNGKLSSPGPMEMFSQLVTDFQNIADICPSCGATAFVYEEGCSKCHACGHSEC